LAGSQAEDCGSLIGGANEYEECLLEDLPEDAEREVTNGGVNSRLNTSSIVAGAISKDACGSSPKLG
jgi:hypothetical protein